MEWIIIIASAIIYYFLHVKISAADLLIFAGMESEVPIFLQRYYLFFSLLTKGLAALIIVLLVLDYSGQFFYFILTGFFGLGALFILKIIALGKGGLIGRDIFRMRMVQYSEMYPEKRDEYLELAKMDVPEILNYGNKWSSI